MARWMRGAERERAEVRDHQLAIAEAARHQLSAELAVELWDRACAEATDASGRLDAARAWRRFDELLARGQRPSEVGKATRVELDRADAEHAEAPGRDTLVDVEARRAREPVRDDPPPAEAPLPAPSAGDPAARPRRWRPRGHALTRLDPARAFHHATRGAARELPFRGQLERLFGTSLAGVRAYTGRHAPLTALGAEAATHGEVISFGPASPDLRLVAHEVAHVLQHRRAAGGGKLVSATSDDAEREAEGVADAAAHARHDAPRLRIAAVPSAQIQLQWVRDLRARWLWIDDVTGDLYDERTHTILRDGSGVWAPVGGQELADIISELEDDHVQMLLERVDGLHYDQATTVVELHELYDQASLVTFAIAVSRGEDLPLVVRIARAVAGELSAGSVLRLAELAPHVDADDLVVLAMLALHDGWPVAGLMPIVSRLSARIEPVALGTIMMLHATWPGAELFTLCDAVANRQADLVRVMTLTQIPGLTATAVVLLAGLEIDLVDLQTLVNAVLQGTPCDTLASLVRDVSELSVVEVLELLRIAPHYDTEDLIFIGDRVVRGLPLARVVTVALGYLGVPKLDCRQLCGLMALHATRDDQALIALAAAAVRGLRLADLVTLAMEFHGVDVDDLARVVTCTASHALADLQALLRELARLQVPPSVALDLMAALVLVPLPTIAKIARAVEHQQCPISTVITLSTLIDSASLPTLLELHAGAYADPGVLSALARCTGLLLSARRIVDVARIARCAPLELIAVLTVAGERDWVAAILEPLANHLAAKVTGQLIARLASEVDGLDGKVLLAILELHALPSCGSFDAMASLARAVLAGLASVDELRELIQLATFEHLAKLLPLFEQEHYRDPELRRDVAKLTSLKIPVELVVEVCGGRPAKLAMPLLMIFTIAPCYASAEAVRGFVVLTEAGHTPVDLCKIADGTRLPIDALTVLLPLRALEPLRAVTDFVALGACVMEVKLPAARAVTTVKACPALTLDVILAVLRLHRFEACRDDAVLPPLAVAINAGTAAVAIVDAMFTQAAQLSGADGLALLALLVVDAYRNESAMVKMAKRVVAGVPCARVIAVLRACMVDPDPYDLLLQAHQVVAYQSDGALIELAKCVAAGVDAARLIRLLAQLHALAVADFVGLLALHTRYADDADIVALGNALAAIKLAGRTAADVVALALAGPHDGAVIAALLQPLLLGAVPPDEIANLDPNQVALFTDAMATALIGDQLKRLPAPCLAALSPSGFAALTCMRDLTQPQAQVITRAQMAGIQQAQLAALHEDRLADVPPPVFARLPGDRVADLEDRHVGALLPGQLAALAGAQLARLVAARFAVLDQPRLAALLPGHGAALDLARLQQIQPNRVQHLAAETLAAVRPAVVAGLDQVALGTLGAGHLQALTHAQLRALPPQSIADLQGNAIHLHSGQLAALTPAQVARLDANLGNALAVAQLQALSPEQFAQLHVNLIAGLPQAQLQAITSPQLFAMTDPQIAALQPGQLPLFLDAQRAALLPRVSQAQAAVMVPPSPNNATLNTLLPGIGGGGGNVVPSVPHTVVNPDPIAVGAVAGLNAMAIAALSPLEISTWTDAHVGNLGANIGHFANPQLAAIRPAVMWAVPNGALSVLAGAQLSALSPAQLAGLTTAQINQIGHAELAQLTGDQVPWLTAACIAALDQNHVHALDQPQLAALTPGQLTALSTQQLGWLDENQYPHFTALQIAGLPVSVVPRIPVIAAVVGMVPVAASGWNAIAPAVFAALGPSHIRAFTGPQLAQLAHVLEEAQLAALAPAQIPYLPVGQLQVAPPARLHTLSTAQVQALSPAQIAQLTLAPFSPEQAAVLLPAQRAAAAPLVGVPAFDLLGVPAGNIAALPALSFPHAPLQHLLALADAQVAALQGDQLAQLTDAQLQAIAAFGALDPLRIAPLDGRVAQLTITQLASLSDPQFQALQHTQFAALSPPQIAALRPEQIALLTQPQAAGFDLARVQALTPAQLAQLPDARLVDLGANITALGNAQLACLTALQIYGLADDQPSLMTVAQVQHLTPTQANGLRAAQLDAMVGTANLQALSVAAVGELGWVLPTIAAPTANAFTVAQIAALGPSALFQLPAGHLAALGNPAAAALSVESVAALPDNRVPQLGHNRLSREQIAGLTADQVSYLVRTQLHQPAQPADLDDHRLAWLFPRIKVADLLAALPAIPAQGPVRSLPAGLMAQLSPPQLAELGAVIGGGPASDRRPVLLSLLPPERGPQLRGLGYEPPQFAPAPYQRAAMRDYIRAVNSAPPAAPLDDSGGLAATVFDDILSLPPIRLAQIVENILVANAPNWDALTPWFRGNTPWHNNVIVALGMGQLPGGVAGNWEYDIYPWQHGAGVNRGTHRIVISVGGNSYYTPDHYRTFFQIR